MQVWRKEFSTGCSSGGGGAPAGRQRLRPAGLWLPAVVINPSSSAAHTGKSVLLRTRQAVHKCQQLFDIPLAQLRLPPGSRHQRRHSQHELPPRGVQRSGNLWAGQRQPQGGEVRQRLHAHCKTCPEVAGNMAAAGGTTNTQLRHSICCSARCVRWEAQQARVNKPHRLIRANRTSHLAQQAQRGLSQLRVLRHAQRVPVGPPLKHLGGGVGGKHGEAELCAGVPAATSCKQHLSCSLSPASGSSLHTRQQQRRSMRVNSAHPAVKAVPSQWSAGCACMAAAARKARTQPSKPCRAASLASMPATVDCCWNASNTSCQIRTRGNHDKWM